MITLELTIFLLDDNELITFYTMFSFVEYHGIEGWGSDKFQYVSYNSSFFQKFKIYILRFNSLNLIKVKKIKIYSQYLINFLIIVFMIRKN